MSDDEFQTRVERIVQKVKHHLITSMGRTSDEATEEEFYRAFCWALREEIMINWTAMSHSFTKAKPRKLFYLSLEYMPGRLTGNNISNLHEIDLVKAVLGRLNRNLNSLLRVEPDIGVGNGGLGRLASCFLDSLATLRYPATAYGLRYQYGIFEQQVWCGVQLERPEPWLLNENPWEFRRDSHAVSVHYSGKCQSRENQHQEEVCDLIDSEEVRALPYDYPIIGYSEKSDFSVLTLRLWSTKESPRNFSLQRFNAGELGLASENTGLTDVLYPNDNHDVGKRIRLKQEFLLVSASMQDIFNQYWNAFDDISFFGDRVRIQINDTHPSLIIAELMLILTQTYDLPWNKAWEITQSCCSYTNHTVLRESLEEWNVQRLEELLPRQYRIIQKLNEQFCRDIRQKFPGNEEKLRDMSFIEGGQVKMANLAMYGAHRINGVSALHTDILRRLVFNDFNEFFPDKFVNVTNGVTQRRWILNANPDLAAFITHRIGPGWITNFEEISKLHEFASDEESQKNFLEIKRKNKRALIEYLHEQGKVNGDLHLDDETLFDVQVKRIHEYKRQLMFGLSLLMRYHELKENPNSTAIKRFAIFGGKAAPGYERAKDIIRFIYCLSRRVNQDQDIHSKLKILFIENYNVTRAELIIPAADLSEQISTAGTEASGTGNMKFSMNGALTIGTDDGANVEMKEAITEAYWPFSFGNRADENLKLLREGAYHPKDVLEIRPDIAKAVNRLKDGSLAENEAEHETLVRLYHSLMEDPYIPDRYFVLKDLIPYHETQHKVEELFAYPLKWAELAIHNMAGMGPFSTDVSIKNYAEKIWGLTPCPMDLDELKRIRQEA